MQDRLTSVFPAALTFRLHISFFYSGTELQATRGPNEVGSVWFHFRVMFKT